MLPITTLVKDNYRDIVKSKRMKSKYNYFRKKYLLYVVFVLYTFYEQYIFVSVIVCHFYIQVEDIF